MEWRTFDHFEPIGGPALDYRIGILARTVLASVGAEKLPEPLDFFPWTASVGPIVLSPEELCRQSELGLI